MTVDWRSRWTTALSHTEEFKRFEKDFRNRQTDMAFGFNTRSYESVTGGVTVGRNFDADFSGSGQRVPPTRSPTHSQSSTRFSD